MRQSKLFLKTSKTVAADDVSVNARLLEQAGFITKTMAGVYTFLPLGLRVLAKIENVIREEMNALGASEILMPALQPKENWQTTGRWETVDVLFKVKSIHEYEAALGPTHEEIVTPVAARWIASYKDLPTAVYQIQTKFRDEARAKSGLLRGREFRMKDLYSFHASDADFEDYYAQVGDAYMRIFKRLGLSAMYTEASGGTFSKFSHEFQVAVASGEDTIYVCTTCGLAKNKEVWSDDATCTKCSGTDFVEQKACEVGNIFPLKTKFSEPFGLTFTDEQGNRNPVIMGCYGIGSSRIMGVIVETSHDDRGIIWSPETTPFDLHMLVLSSKDESVRQQADGIYNDLRSAGVDVLYDDRASVTAGEKFADSDLIGIPKRLVISEKSIAQGGAEYKERNSAEATIIPFSAILEAVTSKN